jgi:WD40 repeat protein
LPGQELDGPEIRRDKQVRVTSFSEDGRLLLVGGEDMTAQVWDVQTRLPIGQRLEHRGEVRAGAVSLAAGRVVTADFAGEIRVWDLQPVAQAGWVFPHPSPVWDATFNEAGDRVLTGCASSVNAPGSAFVWKLAGGDPVPLRHGADVMVARFRPNSPDEAVTCGNDGSVFFWNTTTGKKIGAPLSHENRLVYSADFDKTGNRFVFAGYGGIIRICDFNSANHEFRPHEKLIRPFFSFVWNVRFGPKDGQLFSDGGSTIRVWDLNRGGEPLDLQPPKENENIDSKDETRLGGFNRIGNRAITLGMDGRAAVWDLMDRSRPPQFLGLKPHGSGRLCADWNGVSDLIATGGPDGVVRLWSADGKRWSAEDFRHPSSIEVLKFSPDGRWLATGCRDGGLRLWSVTSGVWTGAGWYHAGPVTRVEFSSDGKYLLSASRDGTARVVSVPGVTNGTPKQILAELEADAGILVAVKGEGAAASVTAPHPLTAKDFKERRAYMLPTVASTGPSTR